jgi:hypothetical protein
VTDQQGGLGVVQHTQKQFIWRVGVDEALRRSRLQDGQMQGNDGGGVLGETHRHDLIRLRHSVADDGGELVGQLIKLCIRQ